LPAAQSFEDLAEFSELADFSGQTVQESHLALQIRSRTELRTRSDGTVSERTSTKLRFHYDLTTADGQHIELNVKAKVGQTSVQDGAGNSVTKTQVKLQFSLLQEGVADDLAPLQSDQVPSETQSGVADGLQAFLSAVGDAVQNFVEGDNITADDLVTKTVDTFNTLLDALTHLLFPAAGNEAPPALPADDEPPVQISAIPPPPPNDSEPGPAVPADGGVGVSAENSEPETPSAASDDSALAGDSANSAASIPTEGSALSPAEPSAATSPDQLATQVLQTIRLRFVQSLTQIIRSLTSKEPSGDTSITSQRLDYHSSLSLKIQTASLMDVNA
jgi:hypothetical protein